MRVKKGSKKKATWVTGPKSGVELSKGSNIKRHGSGAVQTQAQGPQQLRKKVGQYNGSTAVKMGTLGKGEGQDSHNKGGF